MTSMHFGPFEVGRHTLWLDSHGFFMLVALAGLAFLAGAIAFARQCDARLLRGLRTWSTATLLALLALTITGLVPDVAFEKGADFSGAFHNGFGTFQASVTDDNLGAFTGPLLFDIMEHNTLVVPGLALLLCFLVFHYGRRVVEDDVVRRTTQWVIGVTAFWIVLVGGIGVYITKVLTFPYTR